MLGPESELIIVLKRLTGWERGISRYQYLVNGFLHLTGAVFADSQEKEEVSIRLALAVHGPMLSSPCQEKPLEIARQRESGPCVFMLAGDFPDSGSPMPNDCRMLSQVFLAPSYTSGYTIGA